MGFVLVQQNLNGEDTELCGEYTSLLSELKGLGLYEIPSELLVKMKSVKAN